MRKPAPWEKRPERGPVIGIIYDNAPPRTPPVTEEKPPWKDMWHAARDLGGSATWYEGTKSELKVPVGWIQERGGRYNEPITYHGVTDPDLIERFVTEQDRMFAVVQAEADARLVNKLEKLEKRVLELEGLTIHLRLER